MSKKTNGVNYGKTVNKTIRRKKVIDVLEHQLKTGVKTQKKTSDVKVPLTEKDINRIKKEIKTLKSRI